MEVFTPELFSELMKQMKVRTTLEETDLKRVEKCVFPKNGKTPHIIHLFIGFSIIFTIHFGVPLFLETSKSLLGYFFHELIPKIC